MLTLHSDNKISTFATIFAEIIGMLFVYHSIFASMVNLEE